jgi:hypothetical protein
VFFPEDLLNQIEERCSPLTIAFFKDARGKEVPKDVLKHAILEGL